MGTVRLTVPVPIGRACDTEGTRYALGSAAVFTGGDQEPWIVATNSRILACYPLSGTDNRIELENGEPCALVPQSCLPRSGKQFGQAIECDGQRWFTPWGKSSETVEGRFPKYTEVIPQFSGSDRHVQVTIDPALLLDLARSIGAESVTLLLPRSPKESKHPRIVTGPIGVLGDGEGLGVIMPLYREQETEVVESFLSRRERAIAAGGPRSAPAKASKTNEQPSPEDESTQSLEQASSETGEPSSVPAADPLVALSAFARSRVSSPR